MKKFIALLLVVFTVSVFLSGCSDSDSTLVEDIVESLDRMTEDNDVGERAIEFLDDRGLGF